MTITPAHPRDPVARAREYPYWQPPYDVVVAPSAATMRRATPADLAAATEDRTAVIAIGSNGAPSQLVHKFADTECGSDDIVVARATWRDHDSVYAARVCSYGAIPSTFTPSPGCTVSVSITFLTDAQLVRMDETEGLVAGVYRRVRVDPAGVHVERGPVPREVFAYEATCGPLELDGRPVALSAFGASGREFPEHSEGEMLDRLAHVTPGPE